MHEHIDSFPKVESYFAREKTSRLYLEQSLNTTIMYDLYKEQCIEKGLGYVKQHKYRQIYNGELTLPSSNQKVTGVMFVKNLSLTLRKRLFCQMKNVIRYKCIAF